MANAVEHDALTKALAVATGVVAANLQKITNGEAIAWSDKSKAYFAGEVDEAPDFGSASLASTIAIQQNDNHPANLNKIRAKFNP